MNKPKKELFILNKAESKKIRVNSKSWLCNCEICRYWRRRDKNE